MIDDDTNKQLLRTNDELIQLVVQMAERKARYRNFGSAHTARGRPHPYLVRGGQEQTACIKSRRVNLYAREIHFQSDSNTLFAGVIARQDFFIPSLMKTHMTVAALARQ